MCPCGNALGRGQIKYCSQDCKKYYQSAMNDKPCQWCGTVFRSSPSKHKKYCSMDCRSQAQVVQYRKHPLFETWKGLKGRVNSNEGYIRLGITMADEWRDFETFRKYIENNLGPRPDGYSLDRINTYKGYEPGNVRWATNYQQQANVRKKTIGACSSKYMGVTWSEPRQLWLANIIRFGTMYRIGSFKSELDAACAYVAAHNEIMPEAPKEYPTDDWQERIKHNLTTSQQKQCEKCNKFCVINRNGSLHKHKCK